MADLEPGLTVGKCPARGQAGVHDSREVFGIQQPNNVLAALLRIVNRDARVLLFHYSSHGFFERQVGWQRKDIVTRHHDLADGQVTQFQGVVHHLFLGFRQQADSATGRDNEFQFFRRVDSTFPHGARAEAAQDEIGRLGHEEQERTHYGDEEVHGAGYGKRNSLRFLQGQRFRHQFTKEDVHVGNHHKGQSGCYPVSVKARIRDVLHPRHQNGRERAFAHPSQGQTGESHAELDSRQKFIEPLLEPLDDPGAHAALLD